MSLHLVLRTEIAASVEAAVQENRAVDKPALVAHFARHFELFGISLDEITAEVDRAVAGIPRPAEP